MKTFRKLQRATANGQPTANFVKIVRHIERVLGPFRSPEEAAESRDCFAVNYLRYNIMRKQNIVTQESEKDERRALTIQGLLKQEAVNKLFNQSATFGYSTFTGEYSSDLLGDKLLYRARDIIHDILGVVDIDDVIGHSSFGNGASATLSRAVAQAPHKFKYGLSTTRGLQEFSNLLLNSSPAWHTLLNPTRVMYGSQSSVSFVPPHTTKVVAGSVLDVVPKDAKIDRVIMKEPELNGFIQKGIGSVIRNKLRSYRDFAPDGMNISTSGDLNQGLAKAGSMDGHIATVDAERASDSITLALCEFLLPEAFYRLLLAARSPYVVIDGSLHRLEMMSGMGNGFTFELESMIFYAIGLACSEKSNIPFAHLMVSVHGDDLTVPSDVQVYVESAYLAAGLTINKEKSYFSGAFRESCGGHYFEGHSVKPFFVKNQDGSTRGDWFWLSNSLLLWLCDRNTIDFLDNGKYTDLVSTLNFLMWYATSGEYNRWSVPITNSRRSGLFGNPVMTRGAFFKTKCIKDKPLKQPIEEQCAYVNWLNKPILSSTVLELLDHKSPSSDPYVFDEETIEVEGWSRIFSWPNFENAVAGTPLWFLLQLHKLI